MVKSKVPHSVDSVMLAVGSRLSCSFKIIRSVQLHCLPSDLIRLDIQIEEQLKGKEMFFNSSGRKYNPNSKTLGRCMKLK